MMVSVKKTEIQEWETEKVAALCVCVCVRVCVCVCACGWCRGFFRWLLRGSTWGKLAPSFCKTIEEVMKLQSDEAGIRNALLTHSNTSRPLVCGSHAVHSLLLHTSERMARWRRSSYSADSGWDRGRREVYINVQSPSITSSEQYGINLNLFTNRICISWTWILSLFMYDTKCSSLISGGGVFPAFLQKKL